MAIDAKQQIPAAVKFLKWLVLRLIEIREIIRDSHTHARICKRHSAVKFVTKKPDTTIIPDSFNSYSVQNSNNESDLQFYEQ